MNPLIKNKFRFELVDNNMNNFLDQVQDVSFPSVTLRNAHVTRSPKLSQTMIAGSATYFEDFQITFLIDEYLNSYFELYKWMLSVQNPTGPTTETETNVPHIGLLHVMNGTDDTIVMTFKFIDIYPKSLSGLEWTTKEGGNLDTSACTVTFGYTMFELIDSNGNVLKPRT